MVFARRFAGLRKKVGRWQQAQATLVFPLLIASCGGSPDATNANGPVPVENVAAVWRKALCDKIYECCSPAERMNNPGVGTSVQDCQGALEREASTFFGDLPTSVAAGRVAYHPDLMSKCLADLKARSCDLIKMPPGGRDVTDMCEGVFEPKVPVGGACLEYWDCIGGWCAGDLGGLQDVCTAKSDDGAVCDEGPECKSGLCDEHNACAARPAGFGNLCEIGQEAEGQHQGQR
jgi:hypothetical protein